MNQTPSRLANLKALARFVEQHDCHAHVVNDRVRIGSHAIDRDNVPFTMLDDVQTLQEARDALGY
jgi:hypothetical protein